MRFLNSVKNFFVGIGGNIITLILGFVSRYLFLMILNVEYLGVSGLFSSILTMLSFAELGIGTAIVYSLYKPLAEKNEREILVIMQFFRKVYTIIGIVVFFAGMALLPFLDFFITDRKGIDNLELIYVLFLINTSISYFFSYNRSLITADQKAYKLVMADYIYKFAHVLLPILTLWIAKNYIVYLVTQIVTTFLWNLIVFFIVRNQYPMLKTKEKYKITKEVKDAIVKNTFALMIYKIAIVVTSGTDNLLITKFFGLTAVGLCSNYTLVIQNLTSLLSQGMNAVTASVGNLNSSESDDKKYDIFKILFFMNFWIYSFASLGLYFCINPLISVCFGSKYVVEDSILIPMVISFFLLGMQSPTSIFRDAQGLFWQGKFRPIAQTIINLGSSILLAKLTNNVGAIFWGTAISRLCTNFWFDPYIVYKHGFHKPIMPYFVKYLGYVLLIIPPFAVCYILVHFLNTSSNAANLIIDVVLTTLVVNAFYLLFFFKTKEFDYLKNSVFKNFKNILVKKGK